MIAFKSRFSRPAAVAAVALLALASGVQSVAAQSFFEALFGPPSWKQTAPPPRMFPPGPSGIAIPPSRLPERYPPAPRDDDDTGRTSRSGGYRTLCVRMCDGFYFPINQSTSRGGMLKDSDACRQRCGSTELRLFYAPAGSVDMNDAVDLQGRSYTRLQNAFLYRKRLISGCTCKSDPWTEAELIRHRKYAIAEGKTPSALPSALLPPMVVVAGGDYGGNEPTPLQQMQTEQSVATSSPAPSPDPMHASIPLPAFQPLPRSPRNASKATDSRPARQDRGKPGPEAVAQAQSRRPPTVATAASQATSWQNSTTSKYGWPGDAR